MGRTVAYKTGKQNYRKSKIICDPDTIEYEDAMAEYLAEKARDEEEAKAEYLIAKAEEDEEARAEYLIAKAEEDEEARAEYLAQYA